MSLLWLKKLDGLSKLAPKTLLRGKTTPKPGTAIVRPGGLGDMVLLTKAVIELGLDPSGFSWFAEKRNSIWLEYLGVPFRHYHEAGVLLEVGLGKSKFEKVICTEQFHGLAAVFSARLAVSSSQLSGFSINPRADLFDKVCEYTGPELHELEEFKNLFELSGFEKRGKEEFKLPACEDVDIEGNYVVLALAGLNHPHKKLSLDNWKRLYERALGYTGQVVLLGSKAEAAFASNLEKSLGSAVINKVGKQDFKQTIDLIRHSKRLVSVDSGLVHVADFFGIKSDVVFAWNSPAKWGPRAEGSKVLDPKEI